MTVSLTVKFTTNLHVKETRQLFVDSMVQLVNESSQIVQGVATGEGAIGLKTYLSLKDGRTNPSIAGEPPALRTGTLRRSWIGRTFRSKKTGDKIILRMKSNAAYARALEFGASYKGGQPYFVSKEIAQKQGRKEPPWIAFAKKSSPHAKRMKKTKPWTLEPRPYLSTTIKDAAVIAAIDKRTKAAVDRVREQVKSFRTRVLS